MNLIHRLPLQQINQWLLCLLIFSFPINWRLSPLLIFLLFTGILISGGIPRTINILKETKEIRTTLFLYYAIFILYTLGLLYSSNLTDGLTILERKLTFVVLPFILMGIHPDAYDQKNKKIFLYALLSGAVISGMIMIGHSLFHSSSEGFIRQISIPKYKYYHHTYYAIYLCIVVCFTLADFKTRLLHPVFRWLLLILFCLLIYLSYSRTGMIALVTILSVYGFSLWVNQKKRLLYLLLIVPVFTIALIITINHPYIQRTISGTKSILQDNASPLTTTGMQRITLWKTAVECISKKPVFGYGIGSANDALHCAYKDLGLQRFAKLRFNTHNQFLEITLDAGIIGLLLLLALFISLLISACKQKNIPLIMIVAIFFIGFLFESMLNRFAGIFPFVFFPFYLLLIEKNQQNNSLAK